MSGLTVLLGSKVCGRHDILIDLVTAKGSRVILSRITSCYPALTANVHLSTA